MESSHWILSDEYPCARLSIISQVFTSFSMGWKDFWKSSKPCHVGTHWKAPAENFHMSTHMPGFKRFFRILALFCIDQICQQHKGYLMKQTVLTVSVCVGWPRAPLWPECSAAWCPVNAGGFSTWPAAGACDWHTGRAGRSCHAGCSLDSGSEQIPTSRINWNAQLNRVIRSILVLKTSLQAE